MSEAKTKITELVQAQPEAASYDDIMRELAFARMVEKGLEDSRNGRVISDKDMERQIHSWKQRG